MRVPGAVLDEPCAARPSQDCESHSPEWCKALAEVLTDLATAKLTAGGVEVAEAMYREALTVDGACAAAEYNLG